MARKKGKHSGKTNIREPWIKKKTGYVAIAIISLGLAVWVAWQIIATEHNIGKGVLWGLIYAATIWAVFFAMNLFHSFFRNKED